MYATDGDTLGTGQLIYGSGGVYFFGAKAVANGFAFFNTLWIPEMYLHRTDGTSYGTIGLIDMHYTLSTDTQKLACALGNEYIFSAADNLHGMELWKTNGYAAGTQMIRDLRPGTLSSAPENPHLLNDKIIFDASLTDSTAAIWVTDGTYSGTHVLGDSTGLKAWILGRAGSNIYFGINHQDSTYLWITDGTDAGTTLIRTFQFCDLASGTKGDTLVQAYGLTFFVHNDSQFSGYLSSIWATDGTGAGTNEVFTNPDTSSLPISQLTAVCGSVFAEVRTGNNGESRHLWSVQQDTASNLHLFPNNDEDPQILFADDGALFFSANDSVGNELYKLQVCPAASLESALTPNSLSLFPNPNNGSFTLDLPGHLTNGEVTVSDMMGRCRYRGKVSGSLDQKVNLHLENISAGVYSVQITSGEKRQQQLFIKQ